MTLMQLNKLDIFSELTNYGMKQVYSLMKKEEVPGGQILFQEGDEGSIMYVVLSGEVAVSIKAEDRDLEVARVGEGGFFGEMSILEKDVRSATCRTASNCELLSLDAEAFQTLIGKHPKMAMSIMSRMLHTATSRLRKTGAFLSDMVQWGEQARIRALSDEFTGMYNRRFFDESLDNAVLEANMGQSFFSLIMVDLDRFGTLNALYGEAVGDAVILAVVPVFKKVFDEEDILCRYGGDEFAFILPGKTGEEALQRCRKLRKALTEIDLLKDKGGDIKNVTASIGIAQCPIHGESVSSMLQAADKALYIVKEAGRDGAGLYVPEEQDIPDKKL